MAKRTALKSFRSGINLSPAPFFGYEVSLYKLYKDRVELVGSKLYSSPVKLTIKKETSYTKYEDCLLMKCVDWLYAPRDFIIENGFNLIEEEENNGRKSKNRKHDG